MVEEKRNEPEKQLHSWVTALRSPMTMVLVALLLRFLAIAYVSQFQSPIPHAEAGLGGEMGRVARSIALGEGFSSPLHVTSGPTAWVGPVYPYLLAGAFKAFGIYSDTSAIAIRVLNSLFSALTCLTIFLLARDLFGKTTAVWAGWAWAFFPNSIKWSTLVWDTSLVTLLVALAFLVTIRIRETHGNAHAAGYGLLWGLIGLTGPAALSLYPVCLGGLYFRMRGSTRAVLRVAAVSGVALGMSLLPWTVRNALAFGEFIPVKGDLGFSFYLGNHKGGDGTASHSIHPWSNPDELARYQELGERAYFNEKQALARAYVESNPGRFFQLTAKRAFSYWVGSWRLDRGRLPPLVGFILYGPIHFLVSLLALGGILSLLRERDTRTFLLAGALVVFPLPYYVTFVSARFRFPIEPILVILAVWFLTRKRDGSLAPNRVH